MMPPIIDDLAITTNMKKVIMKNELSTIMEMKNEASTAMDKNTSEVLIESSLEKYEANEENL